MSRRGARRTATVSRRSIWITIRGNVTRVTVTIGYLGYLLIAIQSTEGLIVIGLAIVFLIILFTLAEIWGRSKDGPEEAEAGEEVSEEAAYTQDLAEDDGDKSPRQLKKEARTRQKAEVARLKASWAWMAIPRRSRRPTRHMKS